MTSTCFSSNRQKVTWKLFATIFVLAALASPGQQQQGRGHKRDLGDISSERLLAQFLSRRLLPQSVAVQRRPWPVAARGWDKGDDEDDDEYYDSVEEEEETDDRREPNFYNLLGTGTLNGGFEVLDYEETENVSSEYYAKDCTNCVDESSSFVSSNALNRWTMPLLKLGEKRYYLGIFFKANWYRANRFCRFHGMQLASISSAEENQLLEDHIKAQGLGHEHFWTSGTDQGEEGTFFWLSTGRPVTYTNWNAGEPNNFRYENGEEEHCLELWNRDGKGLKWNDTPCSFETFFVCEVQ